MTTTLLTNIGLAEITNSFISGFNVNLTQIAVGDGEIVLSPDTTALVSEKWRGNLSSISLNPEKPNQFVARINVPSTVGGFTAREVGLYDNQNRLIAIGILAAVELIVGQTSLTISMAVEVSAEHIGVINITSVGPWIHASEKSQPGGVATLGSDGKVVAAQLPVGGGGTSKPPIPIDLTPSIPEPALVPTAGAVAPVISGTSYSFVENNFDDLVSADVEAGDATGFWMGWRVDAMVSSDGYVGLGFNDAVIGDVEWRLASYGGLKLFPDNSVIDSAFTVGDYAVACIRADGTLTYMTENMSSAVVVSGVSFSIAKIFGVISPPKNTGATPAATFITDEASLPPVLQAFVQAEGLPNYISQPPALPVDTAVGDVFYVTSGGRFNGETYTDPDNDGNSDAFQVNALAPSLKTTPIKRVDLSVYPKINDAVDITGDWQFADRLQVYNHEYPVLWRTTVDDESISWSSPSYLSGGSHVLSRPASQSVAAALSLPSVTGELIAREENGGKFFVNFFGAGVANGDRYTNFGVGTTIPNNSYYYQVHGDYNFSNAGYSRNVVMYGDYNIVGTDVTTANLNSFVFGNKVGSKASDTFVRGQSNGNNFFARNDGEEAFIYRMKGDQNAMTGDAYALRTNIACLNRNFTLAWVSTSSAELLQMPNLSSPSASTAGIHFRTEAANGGTPITVMCIKARIHATDKDGNDHLVIEANCIARRGTAASTVEILGTPIYTRVIETGDATNWDAEFIATTTGQGKIDISVGTSGTAKRIYWNADISIIQNHIFQN